MIDMDGLEVLVLLKCHASARFPISLPFWFLHHPPNDFTTNPIITRLAQELAKEPISNVWDRPMSIYSLE